MVEAEPPQTPRAFWSPFACHGSDAVAATDILAALDASSAKLGEIALGIHRKKTPELAFDVLRDLTPTSGTR
jgi:hypothetical protein